jgi:hypothetical protein
MRSAGFARRQAVAADDPMHAKLRYSLNPW